MNCVECGAWVDINEHLDNGGLCSTCAGKAAPKDYPNKFRREPWSKEKDKNKEGQWRKKPSNQGKKRKSINSQQLRTNNNPKKDMKK